jgi:hypothetical protein
MKKLSIYFIDGKSLALSIDEGDYEAFIKWINGNDELKPFKVISNKLEYYILKKPIQYIII